MCPTGKVLNGNIKKTMTIIKELLFMTVRMPVLKTFSKLVLKKPVRIASKNVYLAFL